jgi:hypothetical protein
MAGGAGTWPEGVAVAAAVIETLEDARQQQELLRFERLRGLVGELERQHLGSTCPLVAGRLEQIRLYETLATCSREA